jgi:hypothetical protein
MPGITLGVGDIVAMRQQHEPQTAALLDRVHDMIGPTRGVDHRVAGIAMDQKGMRPPGMSRVIAEAPDPLGHWLGKQSARG